jgi:hypothetical protein
MVHGRALGRSAHADRTLARNPIALVNLKAVVEKELQCGHEPADILRKDSAQLWQSSPLPSLSDVWN